jgi:hypothetical protein
MHGISHIKIYVLVPSSLNVVPVLNTWILLTSSHPAHFRRLLTLSSHLCLGLPSGFLTSVSAPKILCVLFMASSRATYPAYFILDLFIVVYLLMSALYDMKEMSKYKTAQNWRHFISSHCLLALCFHMTHSSLLFSYHHCTVTTDAP